MRGYRLLSFALNTIEYKLQNSCKHAEHNRLQSSINIGTTTPNNHTACDGRSDQISNMNPSINCQTYSNSCDHTWWDADYSTQACIGVEEQFRRDVHIDDGKEDPTKCSSNQCQCSVYLLSCILNMTLYQIWLLDVEDQGKSRTHSSTKQKDRHCSPVIYGKECSELSVYLIQNCPNYWN